jgi:hypothetical protein
VQVRLTPGARTAGGTGLAVIVILLVIWLLM